LDRAATIAGDAALQWAWAHALEIGPETVGSSLDVGVTTCEWAMAALASTTVSAVAAPNEVMIFLKAMSFSLHAELRGSWLLGSGLDARGVDAIPRAKRVVTAPPSERRCSSR
jgi:hypothetical protein